MSRPFKLYRLQQIDSQLDWINTRLAEITTALQANESVRQATDAAYQTAGLLLQAQQALRKAEDEVRQQRIKIEQTNSTLYGGKVRNPKELKDLENELASLKRYLGVLEDRQLDAMLSEEEGAAADRVAQAALQQAQANFDSQVADLLREQEKIGKDRLRLEDERHAASGAVAPEDQAVYDRLRKARRGVAVSKVVERSCSACGSTLNAALLNAAHSPNALSLCDTCGRILYIG
ncbi:MAG: zinc ribbon domain-containing protein [Chloroflexota bacterium]